MDIDDLLKTAKAIPGYDGYYATPCGQVISTRCRVPRLLKPSRYTNGYVRIAIKARWQLLHRLVAAAFYGPAPTQKHMACHNDGDKNNNCAANLRWDTAVNNERDKAAHGTKLNGTRNHKSRLTEADIIAIRLLLAQGEKQLSIAETFGVSYKTISKIKLRQRWGWLAA